jgi:hypothetical protein
MWDYLPLILVILFTTGIGIWAHSMKEFRQRLKDLRDQFPDATNPAYASVAAVIESGRLLPYIVRGEYKRLGDAKLNQLAAVIW